MEECRKTLVGSASKELHLQLLRISFGWLSVVLLYVVLAARSVHKLTGRMPVLKATKTSYEIFPIYRTYRSDFVSSNGSISSH